MLHRFLTLSQTPELRLEPSPAEAGMTTIELFVPVDVLWQIEEMIKELKFLKASGYSTSRLSNKLMTLIKPYIVNEHERTTMTHGGSAA